MPFRIALGFDVAMPHGKRGVKRLAETMLSAEAGAWVPTAFQ